MVRALPSFRHARLNLPHGRSPNRLALAFRRHWQRASGLVAEAIQRWGLFKPPKRCERSHPRQGDAKQTVLTVGD